MTDKKTEEQKELERAERERRVVQEAERIAIRRCADR